MHVVAAHPAVVPLDNYHRLPANCKFTMSTKSLEGAVEKVIQKHKHPGGRNTHPTPGTPLHAPTVPRARNLNWVRLGAVLLSSIKHYEKFFKN